MLHYQDVTTEAGLFDRSTQAKFLLTGPDAPMFLNNLSTNDIANLPLGAGCESYFCNPQAKALFQSVIYHITTAESRHALWLETHPSRRKSLWQHLDRYLISEAVEIEDVTDRFMQWHLAGPHAHARLEAAFGEQLPDLQEFQHMQRSLPSGATLSIRKRELLGFPGYDLVGLVEKSQQIEDAFAVLGVVRPSADLWELLRIEAGTPETGVDYDETRFVMEIGKVTRAVSYSKGCYLGQEPIVMSRDRAGHAPRSFVKFIIDHPTSDSLAGQKILVGEEDAGVVTSSATSPRYQSTIGLGYVKWKFHEPGTKLSVSGHPGHILEII